MKKKARKEGHLFVANRQISERIWGHLTEASLARLSQLTRELDLSVNAGHLVYKRHNWYITHAGLLHIALRRKCQGIHVKPAVDLCDSATSRWTFSATVYKTLRCKGFVGYGDADPSNVSPLVRGAEMRVAETRAVNRALRKAYGIGLCSVEELGARSQDEETLAETRKRPPQSVGKNGNHKGNGSSPRVRDRLCQLIRQHGLDPELVKAYAVDYCGVASLKEAQRSQVEQFVEHLAVWAERDREALLCKLNSYPRVETKEQPKEGAA